MLEHLRLMARYNKWANDRVSTVISAIDEADYMKPRDAFFGSIHGAVNHLLLVDRLWRGRMIGNPYPAAALNEIVCEDRKTFMHERDLENDIIIDFVDGLSRALKPGGSISLEFPHLMRLIEGNQFDTIYHEHYSYLSLSVVSRIAGRYGLAVTDVEELATHGGSLRVWLQHEGQQAASEVVPKTVEAEIRFGLETLEVFASFQERASSAALALTDFLVSEARSGRQVIGYGAAAKGNTLLNYAGVTRDILPAVCDKALSKQGKYLPGSQIPIISLSEFEDINPEMVLVK